jgi:hypothetical protein
VERNDRYGRGVLQTVSLILLVATFGAVAMAGAYVVYRTFGGQH